MGIFGRDRIKDGIPAVGRVVSIGPTAKAAKQTGRRDVECLIRLEVSLSGRTPYAVDHTDEVPHNRMPLIGDELPIVVSTGDPTRLRIDWDQAPDLAARSLQAAAQAGRGDIEGTATALGFTLRTEADDT